MPPKKRLESSADFARRAGVSRSAISQALKGRLAAALVDDRIDLDHPNAIAYLAQRGRVVTPPTRAERPSAPPKTDDAATAPQKRRVWEPDGPTSDPVHSRNGRRRRTARGHDDVIEPPENVVADLEEIASVLRPLLEKFGTVRSLDDWLTALEKLERIQGKHLENEETKENLISRELVMNHVIGALKSFTQKLLRDFPKSCAREQFSLARAGGSLEDGEAAIRQMLTKSIRDVKNRVERALKTEQ